MMFARTLFRPLGLMLLALSVALGGGAAFAASDREPLVIQTTNGPHTFAVEVADTPESRAQGLMNRTRMNPRHGMLFNFKRPQQVSMWMRNTPLPLDMLFVDQRGTIIYVEHQAVPHSTNPRGPQRPVLGVVELVGGVAGTLGIAPGDTVEHPMFGTVSEGMR